jgi:hypothetical protein
MFGLDGCHFSMLRRWCGGVRWLTGSAGELAVGTTPRKPLVYAGQWLPPNEIPPEHRPVVDAKEKPPLPYFLKQYGKRKVALLKKDFALRGDEWPYADKDPKRWPPKPRNVRKRYQNPEIR